MDFSSSSSGGQRSEMGCMGLKSRCPQDHIPSGDCRREFISLPFPASRKPPAFLGSCPIPLSPKGATLIGLGPSHTAISPILSLLSLSIIRTLLIIFLDNPGSSSHLAAAAAKSLQSCRTLCDPIDSSPPGSPIPGILQARTLEWVAISCSSA